jgi:pyrroline-5-carboxylate reductase
MGVRMKDRSSFEKPILRFGFIGTGNITTALVEGLCTSQEAPESILVSPRNAAKAAKLAAEFTHVHVAEDNQAVIDGSDVVFLALRPKIAPEVLPQLHFREDQKIVSLIALAPIDLIKGLIGESHHVFRAVPLPTVARHEGPVVLYPDDPEIADVFKKVGTLFVVSSEKDIGLLATVTALISPFFALMDTISEWAVTEGIEKNLARQYTASMFNGLTFQAMAMEKTKFSELAAEAATPGGLNEQALAIVNAKGGMSVFLEALNAVAARLGD